MKTTQGAVSRYSRIVLCCLAVWFGQSQILAFNIGDRVQANGAVNVRPSPAGTPVSGTQSSGSLGTVIGGPTVASLNGTSYTWYNINFDTGVDGWVADIGLLAAYSDLVTQNLTVNPTSGNAGSTVNVSFTIRNQGAGPAAPSTCNVRIATSSSTVTTSDPLIFQVSVPSIAAGGTYNVNQNATIPAGRAAGQNYIWVIEDVGNVAGQGPNTANDYALTGFTITTAYSDLVTESLAVNPTSGNAGSTVNVSFTIHNIGSGAATPSTCNIRIATSASTVTTSDPLLFQVSVPSMAAGATYYVNQNTTIPAGRAAGQNYIWVIEDVGNVAGQGPNTGNDYALTGFTITTAYSDLVTENLVVNPTSGNPGSSVNVSFTIHNIGSGAATPSTCNIRIATSSSTVTTSDPLLFQVSVPSLAAGATYNVNQNMTIPAGRPAGQNYIWVIEDVGNAAGQGPNTGNDYANVGFTVPPQYSDLVTENLVVNPTSGNAGSSVNVTFIIHNLGPGAATPSTCNIRIATSSSTVTTSDPLLFQVSVPSLAAGATYNVNQNPTIPAGRAAGQNYIWVIEDVGNVAGQGPNTGNDYAHTGFVVTTEYSDLVTENLVVNPTSGEAGSAANVSFTIHNLGLGAATPSTCNIRIATSSSTVTTSDPLLFQVSVPSVAAGGTYPVNQNATIPAGRAAGQNYIWVIEDVGNVAGQGPNTGNDYAHTGFTVNPPQPGATLTWPVDAPRVTQDYASYGGVIAGKFHTGIDITSAISPANNTQVLAAGAGTVIMVNNSCTAANTSCGGGWGNYVVIRHNSGLFTLYAHMASVSVALGANATQGQVIGVMGATGNVTGAHIHFDILTSEPTTTADFGPGYTTDHPANLGHPDPRDYFQRTPVRVNTTTLNVRKRPSTSETLVTTISQGQEFFATAQSLNGWYFIFIPSSVVPTQGPTVTDDDRYGWVSGAFLDVNPPPTPAQVKVNGTRLWQDSATYLRVRSGPGSEFTELTKTWGGQSFVTFGTPTTGTGSTAPWYKIYLPANAGATEGWLAGDYLVTSGSEPNNPPNTPSNISPANGATGLSLTLTLQSSAFSDPDADTHAASQWQVLDSAGTTVIWDSGEDIPNKTSRVVQAGQLSSSRTYVWRVRYKDSRDAWSSYSAQTSFTTSGGSALPLGIDVSTYQGTVNWSQVNNPGGKMFALIRASAGKNTKDSRFDQNVVDAGNSGQFVCAWHFAYPEYFTAHEEAQKFLSVAGSFIGAGYLPPALDIEDSPTENSYPYRMGTAALSQWIRDWCAEVEQAAGAKPMVYSTRFYARNYFESSISQYPYWVVTDNGSPDSDPGNMGIWSTWRFQQYRYGESGGTCPGVTGPVDLDSFNGDMIALNNLIGRSGGGASAPVISNPKLTGTTFTLSVPTQIGFNYVLEFKNSLSDANWTPVQTNGGSGGMVGLTNAGATGPSRIYRVRVQ